MHFYWTYIIHVVTENTLSFQCDFFILIFQLIQSKIENSCSINALISDELVELMELDLVIGLGSRLCKMLMFFSVSLLHLQVPLKRHRTWKKCFFVVVVVAVVDNRPVLW